MKKEVDVILTKVHLYVVPAEDGESCRSFYFTEVQDTYPFYWANYHGEIETFEGSNIHLKALGYSE